jgi:hypothetical protein
LVVLVSAAGNGGDVAVPVMSAFVVATHHMVLAAKQLIELFL